MSLQNPVFIPGPTNIPEALRKACDMPTVDHRSSLFAEILQPALAGVKQVLKTRKGEVVIFPATGTGGWEAALANTLSPGDMVLAGRNGMFSHRWIDMCNRFGLEIEVLDHGWGEGLSAERYRAALRSDTGHKIKAVLATHNETATGVVSNIAAIRAALDAVEHPALLLVDGVSSIGSMDFRMDDWGVDIAVTGSQKGFMMPAGLSIVGISQKALKHMDAAALPRCFFDFRDMLNGYANNGYPYTPNVGLLNGLKLATGMLLDEGLEHVFDRHTRIASGVRAAVTGWGLHLCAQRPEWQSDTVSAILVPDGFNATDIVTRAAEVYGTAFGTGLGEVAGKVFRIGHLGMLTEGMALQGIATAEMVMADHGVPITLGSGVAAAQEVYRGHLGAALQIAAE
ncbi:L-aspartate--glyoxylate aminotransferase BhcA [Actibacterium sp. 188UL27-1]|uniref:L-aspartate--glyoxylate aminotransferase BhcA n=1 Tax=Actibacterium sp. 188UL27-1 TaxID=2786961 RepID=UPI00195AC0FC|nr:L-aspartate--glyoxylate aminotransferase BhcA [Actibacterium sp. 188UL27-1]MBM7068375.1 aminotransferase class V-fold PLP-dependent enzyme [Actibacterium sp. 188UL27-1]